MRQGTSLDRVLREMHLWSGGTRVQQPSALLDRRNIRDSAGPYDPDTGFRFRMSGSD